MTTTQFQNNETTDRLGYSWTPIAKPCDYCQSTAALLFCRTHSTFMCMSCDTNLHSQTDKHPRVWLCEVCEHSPAAVTCKADAASLCLTCDHDIHSANPLARRHERIAVVPFFNSAESVLMKFPAAAPIQEPPAGSNAIIPVPDIKVEDYVSDPWMLPDPGFGESKCPVDKSMEFLFNESDKFFEFEDYGLSPDKPFTDCVVPVQATTKPPVFDYSSENAFELDFTGSKISYTTPSLTVSSSIDVGVVPDGGASAFSDISYTFGKDPFTISNTDLAHGSQPGMDREARVLRYREKRKNRKFEKTVRYASRKAYAEIRPRIKGRFAKRTVNKIECVSDDITFGFGSGNNFIDDELFGVVPSFN